MLVSQLQQFNEASNGYSVAEAQPSLNLIANQNQKMGSKI
jgi:hypothetical protein